MVYIIAYNFIFFSYLEKTVFVLLTSYIKRIDNQHNFDIKHDLRFNMNNSYRF